MNCRIRKGMAIPLVLLFIVCSLSFGSYLFFFRKEVKQQNQLVFHALQAEFMAQAALQHALVKIHFFRQECMDAGAAQRGMCPFQGIKAGTPVPGGPNRTGAALDMLRRDCTTAAFPFAAFGEPDIDAILSGWSYEVASMNVLSSFSEVDPGQPAARVQVIRIQAAGTAVDPLGGRGARTEQMTETFHFRKAN